MFWVISSLLLVCGSRTSLVQKLNRKCFSFPLLHCNLEYQPEHLYFTFQLLRYSYIPGTFFAEIQHIISFYAKAGPVFRLKSQCYCTGMLWQSNNWHVKPALLTFMRWGNSSFSRHHTFIWNRRIYDSHLHHESERKLRLLCGECQHSHYLLINGAWVNSGYSHSRDEGSFLILGKGHLRFLLMYFLRYQAQTLGGAFWILVVIHSDH